jgi:SAM-dependent methyltransferase
MPDLARAYLRSVAWRRKLFDRVNADLDGLMLGLMTAQDLVAVDEHYYRSRHSRDGLAYSYGDDAHNTSGLFDWEQAAIATHFPEGGRIVVTGAGAGREVLALLEAGYDAVGFDPNRELVEAGQRLLAERGHPDRLHVIARDQFPDASGGWDGVVVGWGSYTHLSSRARRVDFLQAARRRLQPGAPLLLSGFLREPGDWYHERVFRMANRLRRVLRRPPVELGDTLFGTFVHRFTPAELEGELRSGGFAVIDVIAEPYGHAIARAI